MKVNAFHSSKEKSVYHDNNQCVDGNNIEAKYKVSGTGGLPQCFRCKGL